MQYPCSKLKQGTVPLAQDMNSELTMRGLTDDKQAQLAASLAEPFQPPGSQQQQQQQRPGQQQQGQQQQQQLRTDASEGPFGPDSADPSVHDSERSFELNPQRFDPESGSSPDPSLHAGPHRGGPVKHDSPSEVSREELDHQLDSTLQGSLRATL